MELLRRFQGTLRCKSSQQAINKVFICFDISMGMLCLFNLTFSDNRSQCLASFYLFWCIFFMSQSINHYLLMTIPKIDVLKFDSIIKKLVGIVCGVEILYLLLVIIFWQKSSIHPIYCAMCGQFDWPFLVGIAFVFHFIFSAGFLINLIHLFVTRKYYLIALGGFDVEQRIALQREQALRRVGLMQPNYAYPIDASIRSSKYYKFEDVIQAEIKNEDTCSICLNKKLQGENIVRTSCNHNYHRACIEVWATVNSRCPDCRGQFEEDFTERKLVDFEKDKNLEVIEQSKDGQQNQEQR